MERSRRFNRNRLAIEAKAEALADDEVLKKIEKTIERKKKQRHK
jgi:hypothetical protein